MNLLQKCVIWVFFQSDIIFKEKLPEDQVDVFDIYETSYDLSLSKSLKDRHDFFNIEGELSASILGGLISLSGPSAKFLNDAKKKVNSTYTIQNYRELKMSRQSRLGKLFSIKEDTFKISFKVELL